MGSPTQRAAQSAKIQGKQGYTTLLDDVTDYRVVTAEEVRRQIATFEDVSRQRAKEAIAQEVAKHDAAKIERVAIAFRDKFPGMDDDQLSAMIADELFRSRPWRLGNAIPPAPPGSLPSTNIFATAATADVLPALDVSRIASVLRRLRNENPDMGPDIMAERLVEALELPDPDPDPDPTSELEAQIPERSLPDVRGTIVASIKARTEQLAVAEKTRGFKALRELDDFVLDLMPKMLPDTSGRFALGVVVQKIKHLLEAE